MGAQKDTGAKAPARARTYEAHIGMLRLLTNKAYGITKQTGVRVDYDDLFQLMCVGFTKALKGFDPDRGIQFTTYYGRACWNGFQSWMQKQLKYQLATGEVTITDLGAWMQGDADDPMELINVESDEPTPEELIEARRRAREVIAAMPVEGKMLVRELLSPSERVREAVVQRQQAQGKEIIDSDVRFVDFAAAYGMDESKMRKLIKRIKEQARADAEPQTTYRRKTVVTAAAAKKAIEPAPCIVYRGEELKELGYL